MLNDDEKFEEYLRGFRGTEPPSGWARRAIAQARRRRAAWYAGSAVFLAAAASVLVVIFAGMPDQTRSGSGLQAKMQQVSTSEEPSPVDRGSLTLAYSAGGLEGLNDHLDRANKRFCPLLDDEGKDLLKVEANI